MTTKNGYFTKEQYFNYLIDCIGYSEEDLIEIYEGDGLTGLSDLIADEADIKVFNK